MNYPLKNSQTRNSRNRYRKLLQIVVGIVILIAVFRLAAPRPFDSFFAAVFSPLWRMENTASADDFFATHAALVAENGRLTDELDTLAPQQAALAALEQENAELKALLGRTMPGVKSGLTLGAVLKTPPASAYDTLIIDLGSNENAEIGDKVFALASSLPSSAEDAASSSPDPSPATASTTVSAADVAPASSSAEILIPVGIVAEASADSSKVALFSSPGEKYQVEIGPDHIPAEAIAQGGGTFDAELAQGSDVHVGDPIVVPDIETVTFGTVGAIENDPTQPYMDVLFTEPINIFELRWVLVADQKVMPAEAGR